jgi:hypothetical protein
MLAVLLEICDGDRSVLKYRARQRAVEVIRSESRYLPRSCNTFDSTLLTAEAKATAESGSPFDVSEY